MDANSVDYSYIANEESYRPDQVIIEEGSVGKWTCVILEGQVKIRKKIDKRTVDIATLKEGAVFGETTIFQTDEARRPLSVVADGPVSVGVLDNRRLHEDWASVSPQLRRLMSTLIERLEKTTTKAAQMLAQRAQESTNK
ncbi:cyclic nucleotide-binding domain-containing protein [Thermodesulfobacteriota bacterium]